MGLGGKLLPGATRQSAGATAQDGSATNRGAQVHHRHHLCAASARIAMHHNQAWHSRTCRRQVFRHDQLTELCDEMVVPVHVNHSHYQDGTFMRKLDMTSSKACGHIVLSPNWHHLLCAHLRTPFGTMQTLALRFSALGRCCRSCRCPPPVRRPTPTYTLPRELADP